MKQLKSIMVFFVWIGFLLGALDSGADVQALESSIHGEKHLLSADFRNTSIHDLILRLLTRDGSKWSANGKLAGITSIRLSDVNLEDAIRTIMRNQNYNYTLVLSQTNDKNRPAVIDELTIYHQTGAVLFYRTSPGFQLDGPNGLASESTRNDPTDSSAPPVPPTNAGIDTAAADREIKALMDQMLSEKRVSRDEYDKALKDMHLTDQSESTGMITDPGKMQKR